MDLSPLEVKNKDIFWSLSTLTPVPVYNKVLKAFVIVHNETLIW